ncbi:hypothetical protein Agabi119p4_9778 [Agaricus bisporus var. burnettii]|uniref:Uncharacterized protein n=1 Tax=Agaricus bisporus var. burnettii TaxID=192524 RepID=A0A8H7EX51_AGABI|nr:hypothetical protein Agabi119p4_9778 [Agaricus bisporus var. burnettii]
MPRKAKQQPQPASTPYPSRPPSQAPPPPAHPNAARLTVSDIETMLNPEYAITGMMNLANWSLDSHENRAIMDAVRNRGIAPAVAIANAAARAESKGNVKGPSGQSTGIGAAPPAVKTPPRVPTPPPRVPTPPPPVPTRPPSPPRAPSPSASVLSSKRPISPGSSSSGPSVAAVSVCGSEDSSMVIEYDDATTPRPASPADEEHLDSMEAVKLCLHPLRSGRSNNTRCLLTLSTNPRSALRWPNLSSTSRASCAPPPIPTHAGHELIFTTQCRVPMPVSTFQNSCPSAARTVKSRALAPIPAPFTALVVSAGAIIPISAAPSVPAAPSALVLIPRPTTSSASTLSASTCVNAQIVPRLNAQRTSTLIPRRMRRCARFGRTGSIVLGLNANSPRVRPLEDSEPSPGWVGDSDGDTGRLCSGIGGRTVVVRTNFLRI